jgi:hypothetical protein
MRRGAINRAARLATAALTLAATGTAASGTAAATPRTRTTNTGTASTRTTAGAVGAAASWVTVPVPSTVTTPAYLDSVTAVGPWLAWAVGAESSGDTGGEKPLILRWDGVCWRKVAVPGPAWSGYLTTVSSAPSGNTWALGPASAGGHILHTHGGAWSTVPVPAELKDWEIYAVAAGLADDGWIWGYSGQLGYLLEHWDGHGWHASKVPYAGWGAMNTMHMTTSGIWAAGSSTSGNGSIVHWDGTTWTPILGPPSTWIFNDVLATRPDDVWTSGYYCLAAQPRVGCTDGGPQIAHWNGSAWDTVIRQPGTYSMFTTISPDQAGRPQWAGIGTGPDPTGTRYERYDGTNWTPVPGATTAPPNATGETTVTAHIPGTDATWGVGSISAVTPAGTAATIPVIEFAPENASPPTTVPSRLQGG